MTLNLILGYLAIAPDNAESRKFVRWMQQNTAKFDSVFLRVFPTEACLCPCKGLSMVAGLPGAIV